MVNKKNEDAINENKDSKSVPLPKFVTYGIPVGRKHNIKVVRVDKKLPIMSDHVAYDFRTTVTDSSVRLWVAMTKIYNDNNYDKIKAFNGVDLVASMLSDQHTAVFNISELSQRIWGKRRKGKDILNLVEAIGDIKIRIVRNGKEVGYTNFLHNAYIHNDSKHIQLNFNSFMMFAMAQQYRLMNFDKYMSLSGSASRIYLVMQGWKRYKDKKGAYVKITHAELCDAMSVDPVPRHTKTNLRKDFINAGIDFIYHKYGDYWYYEETLLIDD